MKTKQALLKAFKAIYNTLPVIVGVVLLVSLGNTLIPDSFYSSVFSGNVFSDSLVGSAIGSVLAGNPVTSYIIGGGLLEQGVGLVAVTSFIVAWVTVGVIQFPGEAILLGKKFAIVRNVSAFVLSILVAITTCLVVGLL